MKYIGAHVSTQGGVENAPLNAKAIGATAFAMFTKNQRQWQAKPYTVENIDNFQRNMEECGYTPSQVLPHDGYLINMGNPDATKRSKSLKVKISGPTASMIASPSSAAAWVHIRAISST